MKRNQYKRRQLSTKSWQRDWHSRLLRKRFRDVPDFQSVMFFCLVSYRWRRSRRRRRVHVERRSRRDFVEGIRQSCTNWRSLQHWLLLRALKCLCYCSPRMRASEHGASECERERERERESVDCGAREQERESERVDKTFLRICCFLEILPF